MEHSVRLDRLPEEFEIPASIANRFRYDDAGRRLVFQGFMSKGDFDRLYLISNDWSYRRALEELFRVSTDADVDEDDDEGPQWGLGSRVKSLMASFGLF